MLCYLYDSISFITADLQVAKTEDKMHTKQTVPKGMRSAFAIMVAVAGLITLMPRIGSSAPQTPALTDP
jgi:hypothetical protein